MFKFSVNLLDYSIQLYNRTAKHPFIILAVFCIFVAPFHLTFQTSVQHYYTVSIFIAEVFVIGLAVFYLYSKHNLNYEKIAILLGITAFLLHVMYVLYTPILERNHDFIMIDLSVFKDITKINVRNSAVQTDGHYGYILYWLNNFPTLVPDFNQILYEFTHPPLHHFIAVVWIKINAFSCFTNDRNLENMQILTLFYSGCIIIVTYKLLKEMYLEKLALIIPFAIICFHPQLVLFSGSANNDILCFTFSLAAILFVLKWYKYPLIKNMIFVIIFMSAAVMTKLSALAFMPALFLLFIMKFTKAKNNRYKIIKQIILFCCIFFPLAFFWPLYIHIKYNVLLFFAGGDFFQQRNDQLLLLYNDIVDIDLNDLKTPFIIDSNLKYSFLIAILKTSVFGEYRYPYASLGLIVSAFILFYSNLILIITSLVSMFLCLFQRNIKLDLSLKIFFSVLYLTIMFAYLKHIINGDLALCYKDFRLIPLTMVIGVIAIGLVISAMHIKDSFYSNMFKIFITVAVCLFCTSSILFWVFDGLDYNIIRCFISLI